MDGLAERADPDRHERAAVLAPVVHAGCASLVRAMDDIGEAACAQALAGMAADPTETIMYELVRGARAWDAYQAGGPLQAQHAELLIGPEVPPSPAGVAAMLRTLADAGRCRIEATGDPWRVLLHAPGLPESSAMVLPMPRSAQAEDFLVQVCIGGNRLLASGLMPPGLIRRMWRQTTTAAFSAWHEVNSRRALADHPGFAQVVERPALGLPGVYLVRIPRFPFSPLMPALLYRRPVAWAVFETAAEFKECAAYYQTPGASFFLEAPMFRNRPPPTDRPARLAGGIAEAGHRLVSTPWPDVGAVSVVTVPAAAVERLSVEERGALHRGRYAIHPAASVEEANRIVRETHGPGLDAVPVAVAHPVHPQASSEVVLRSPKLVVVADPGIEHEAQALFLAHLSLAKTPVPAGTPAVVVIGENLDLTEALLPHVMVALASKAGDAGAALAEAMSSEARVVVLDGEALGFAVLSLPGRIERRQHRVTLAVMPAVGDDGSVVELARRLDALVVLVEEAATGVSRRPSGTALLAGMLKRAGVPCEQVTPVSAPPVPLEMIAYELWAGRRSDRGAD